MDLTWDNKTPFSLTVNMDATVCGTDASGCVFAASVVFILLEWQFKCCIPNVSMKVYGVYDLILVGLLCVCILQLITVDF